MQLPRSDILDFAHFSRLFDNKSECYKLFWFQAIARKIKEGHKMMCNYYESNAKRYAAETFSADMSEQYQRFLPLLKNEAKILDLGSGSGRDACYFQKHGYQVTALEPSKSLCKEI